MSFRFRKSVNLGSGAKLNINKKSISTSLGTRGAHTTFSSNGKRTNTVGIPGSGLSYTKTTSGKRNNKKGCGTGCLTSIVIFILLCILAPPSDKNDTTTEALTTNTAKITTAATTENDSSEQHFYDDAEIHDVMNGSGTEKIGEYSVVKIASDEFNDDMLNDWFFNYVQPNDFNYCLIIFKNIGNLGVYASGDMVIKDAGIEIDSAGDYIYSSSENEILYSLSSDGTLKAYESDDTETSQETKEAIEVVTESAKTTEATEAVTEATKTTEATEAVTEAAKTTEATEAVTETEAPTTEYVEMVWIPNTGAKYHSRSSCSNMNNPRQVTRSEAEAMGYTPCKRCH